MGNFGKKVVSASLAVLTSVSMLGGGSFVAVAGAATAADLQAQINALLAQLQSLQGTTSCTVPAASLTVGSTGANVTALQNWLVTNGYGSFTATGYFGALTQAAVAKFQAAAGVTPAVGYYGPMTMAALQARCGTTTTTTTTTTGGSTTLQGGAGSITVDDLSIYSSEEVGEGDEDAEVLAFEIEADEDSDVEITSIKVELAQTVNTNSQDITDYVDSVSIWLNGEMVGEADADEFNEASDIYTKSISLDGAVVDAGETEEFVIAITALNNLDSGDINDDAWTVDVLNVRFKDAEGVTTTEETDADALDQAFDFATSATANNLELKVSNGDEDVNDAHVINVDTGDDTDNVELLSFNIEIEGDLDVMIKDLPVILTTVEAAGTDFDMPGDIVNTLYLFADGEEIGTESLSGTLATTDSQTVTFADIDFTINAGDEVEFVVKARFIAMGTTIDDGDTISADITATQRAAIDAEDESGEDVGTGSMTGTATGGTHALYDIGYDLALVSATEEKTVASETSGTGDQGQFVIKYSVTAFDGDIYIDETCTESGTLASEGNTYTVTNASSNSTSCVLTSTADDAGSSFLVEEGETETFTLTVNATASADAFAQVALSGIGWLPTADGQGTQIYSFNLTDYETDPLYLNLF